MPRPTRRSRRRGGIFAAVAAAGALLSCATGDSRVPESAVARAREALAPFKRELSGALMTALRDGGPEEAIRVCRLEAPRIAARASVGGVEIGRTSHRLRNPENAAPAWTEPFLVEFLEDPADTTSRAVRLDADHVGYVEPIRMKPLCLTCHGPEIAVPLRERLRELYPGDRATGFRENDFRGLFWVELRLDESG